MKKSWMPERVESLEKSIIARIVRVRPGLVQPISKWNEKENLIASRPSRAETGLVEREIKLDSKKRNRARTMRSKSIETQEIKR